MTTFPVRVDQCRFPLHGLNVSHIWPALGAVVAEGPIRVSLLDNGEWFVQDGRHRLIRAQLRGHEWVTAIDHDDDGATPTDTP